MRVAKLYNSGAISYLIVSDKADCISLLVEQIFH